jgi:hypothetical protein
MNDTSVQLPKYVNDYINNSKEIGLLDWDEIILPQPQCPVQKRKTKAEIVRSQR